MGRPGSTAEERPAVDATHRTGGTAAAARRATDPLAGYHAADFPWYGLDEGWTGRRWLGQVGTGQRGADTGAPDYGTLGHGDEPARGPEPRDTRRFAVVVTVARREVRRSADNTGILEATSASSAAWLAGSGLLAATWPGNLDRTLRQNWLDQQSALAWDLADDLDGPAWTSLTLPVNGLPQPFRYRESEHGWVLAGEAPGVLIGAYGRSVSAYGVGFTAVTDLGSYDGR
ncbi:hypothetical protein [Kitasatospora cineracea]|uniref:hypothetical protein n=1 Tax=Kitasatospora cineracea TaxID=88074 RepID=UPI000F4E49E1